MRGCHIYRFLKNFQTKAIKKQPTIDWRDVELYSFPRVCFGVFFLWWQENWYYQKKTNGCSFSANWVVTANGIHPINHNLFRPHYLSL